jgi:basic membrane protein A
MSFESKRGWALVCIFTSISVGLFHSGCRKVPEEERAGLKVALLFAPSGKGDKSYNDMALHGVEQARKSMPFSVREIQPAGVADYERSLRNVALAGMNLVIGIGYPYADPVKIVAPEFPGTNFVVVDGDGGSSANVRSILFRPEEGCFLVGAVAARTSKSGHIGFIAGMNIPIMNRFRCGYEEGARKADPKVNVDVQYIGSTFDAFSNPGRGREIALLMYDRGVDVLFHAAGASGNGVIEAARERKRYVIGVDTDQSYIAPEWVLTSMRKRIDNAVHSAIQDAFNHKFTGGARSLGLKENGVDYVVVGTGPRHIDPAVNAYVERLRTGIIAGNISVCREQLSAP